MTSESDEAMVRLYAADLTEFIATRRSLVAEAKERGDAASASALGRVKKPSVVVWAVNQIARTAPEETEALVGSGSAMRAGLAAGNVAAARAGAEDRKRLVAALRRRAADMLAEAGRSATSTTVERVSRTLYVAAGDPEASRKLLAGTLDTELEGSLEGALEFGITFDADLDATTSEADATDEAERKHAEAAAALDAEATRLEAEADRLERKARLARRAADEARAAAEARI